MMCPICSSSGYANIDLAETVHAGNGFSYRKYVCGQCLTKFTVMFRTPEDRDEEYKRLLKARKKIQAIKNRRMITGEGLLEAKRYMDNLELQMIKDGEMLGTHNRIQGLEASIRIADSRARRLP